MASLNRVEIIGYLGKDPEVRYFPSGDCFCNISVGTTEKWKDKATGEPKESTEWHRVVLSGKRAEFAKMYAKKGALVYVAGPLKTRKWTDNSGVERYTTEIRGDSEFQILGPRKDHGGSESAGQNNQADNQPSGSPRPNPSPPDDFVPQNFNDYPF